MCRPSGARNIFCGFYPALKRWATFATSLQDWTCEDPFDSLALAQGRLSVLPSSTTVVWGRGRPPHSRREGAVRTAMSTLKEAHVTMRISEMTLGLGLMHLWVRGVQALP